MVFRLKINLDNAAFDDCNGTELARILRELARQFSGVNLTPPDCMGIVDSNGLTVGQWIIRES